MEFRKRHELATKHQNEKTIEADKSLLRSKKPLHRLLNIDHSTPLGRTLPFDLVYALTEHFTEDEILANRKNFTAAEKETGETGDSKEIKNPKKTKVSKDSGKSSDKGTGKKN